MTPLIWASDSLPRYEDHPKWSVRLSGLFISALSFSLWVAFWSAVIWVIG